MPRDACDRFENVLDVAMAPVLALDGRNRGDVWRIVSNFLVKRVSEYLLPAPKAWACGSSARHTSRTGMPV